MAKVVHLIGNGRSSAMYVPATGLKVVCNIPPFAVENVYTSVIVDFKMMNSIYQGEIDVPGDWVLGARPKKFMEMKPNFYIKRSGQIKQFYTHLPKYAANHTDFNCGHMGLHWICNELKATEVHMYGFDSLFGFDITSTSDMFLPSDRENMNTQRLTAKWRPIFKGIFDEFKEQTKFVLYHPKGELFIKQPKNIEIVRSTKK